MFRFLQLLIACLLSFNFVQISAHIEASVSLEVIGNGFHRTLVYEVEIGNFTLNSCYAAVYLVMPSSLYANVDELADLKRQNTITACAIGETNVELFVGKAEMQNISICTPLVNGSGILRIPLHQRYQYANKDGSYQNITLPKPILLLGCKNRIREYRVSAIELCSPCAELVPKWREILFTMKTDNYIWTVPVGNLSLLPLVTYVTLAITIIAAILILRTIWKCTCRQHIKND